MRWVEVKRIIDGRPFPLSPQPFSATYLFRTITSPTARTLRVLLGSDDGIKLWLNGKPQFEKKELRGVMPARDRTELNLVAGENRILMKIVNSGGTSGLFFQPLQKSLPAPVTAAIAVPTGDRSKDQQKVLADHYLSIAPSLQATRDQLATTSAQHYPRWTALEFDDSDWKAGRNGAGYERGEGFESLISKPFDFSADMFEKTASVYLRFGFEIEDPAGIRGDLLLKMKYDDGFVAYLNGHRIASANAPKPIRWNSRATGGHDDGQALQFESFNISEYRNKLRKGKNVLAIHGLNIATGSTDMLIVAEIQTNDMNIEQAIGELVDLDAFYKFWAVEGLLGFWDGYSANRNNFFIYFHPHSSKFHFLPWGGDCMFEKRSRLRVDPRAPISVKTMGRVAHKLYQIKSVRERYLKTLREIMDKHWDVEKLLAETQRIEAMIKPGDLHPSQTRAMPGKLAGLRNFIRTRRADIDKETADGMPIWTAAPSPPPQLQARNVQGRGNERGRNAGRGKKNAGRGKKNASRKRDSNTIWQAAKTGNVEALKRWRGGADVNARGPEGTLLSLATLAGKDKVVEFLLSKGAEVNAVNDDGNAALHAAAFLGRVGVVKTLLKNGAAVNARNKEGETPLDIASKRWTPELEKFIKDAIIDGLQIPIDLGTVKAGRPAAAAFLRDNGGKTADDLARAKADNIWNAARSGNLDALKQHLAKKADVNGSDERGITPLGWAVLAGQTRAAEFLIEQGAQVNATNREGNTPLHGAAFLGRIEIVALLIKHKANVNTKNDDGETPLESVASDWTEALQRGTQFTANVLKIKVDMGQLKAARPGIAALLRKHGGKTSDELK